MDNKTFINKLEKAYNQSYQPELGQSLHDGLKYVSVETMKKALVKIPQRYSTLPSVKNVLEICRDIRKEEEQEYHVDSNNTFKASDFMVDQDTYLSWFARLEIKIQDGLARIKPPKCLTPELSNYEKPNTYFETYIMENHKWHLENAFGKDVKQVAWYYEKPDNKYHINSYKINDDIITEEKSQIARGMLQEAIKESKSLKFKRG